MIELNTIEPNPRVTPPSRWWRTLAGAASKVSFGFMTLRDIGFWMRSARTDAELSRLQALHDSGDAFERLYRMSPDPWAAAQSCYSYQRIKYRKALSLLPRRRFQSALDIGCGVGEFTRQLAVIADTVRGIDISATAIQHAERLSTGYPNITFASGSVCDLETRPARTFDLVAMADVIYYLRPIDGERLEQVLGRVAAQVRPGGVLLLTNHCLFHFDEMSRWVRQAHSRARRLPGYEVLCERWCPFHLTTVLQSSLPPCEPEDGLTQKYASTDLPPNQRQNQETNTNKTT